MKRIDALRLMMRDDDTGEITIKICGAYFTAEKWLRVYDYLNADLLIPKEDIQKPKDEAEKKGCNFTATLQQDQSIDTKPVKKVTAGRGKRRTIDEGKLIALAKAGWTREKIAEELRVSVATVYGHLKKAREEGKL